MLQAELEARGQTARHWNLDADAATEGELILTLRRRASNAAGYVEQVRDRAEIPLVLVAVRAELPEHARAEVQRAGARRHAALVGLAIVERHQRLNRDHGRHEESRAELLERKADVGLLRIIETERHTAVESELDE